MFCPQSTESTIAVCCTESERISAGDFLGIALKAEPVGVARKDKALFAELFALNN